MEKRINFNYPKRNVLFWLKFSFAKMLEDQLEDEGVAKIFWYQVSGENTSWCNWPRRKKMVAGSAPCKDIGNKILFFITRKFFNVRCLFTMVKSDVYVKGVWEVNWVISESTKNYTCTSLSKVNARTQKLAYNQHAIVLWYIILKAFYQSTRKEFPSNYQKILYSKDYTSSRKTYPDDISNSDWSY